MLQGPFRIPSFNGYIPRRLQPWIYLLFAFIFLMSGGIYGSRESENAGKEVEGNVNACDITETYGIR